MLAEQKSGHEASSGQRREGAGVLHLQEIRVRKHKATAPSAKQIPQLRIPMVTYSHQNDPAQKME